MLKEEYNCNIPIQKTLYARKEKVFTFNFKSFDIPIFFIGSGKQKLLFKNKFYFVSTFFKYDTPYMKQSFQFLIVATRIIS